MLMPKSTRRKIYEQLFNEGVMVAKKDFHAPQHPELEGIPNLHVIKALQVSKYKILHNYNTMRPVHSLILNHFQPVVCCMTYEQCDFSLNLIYSQFLLNFTKNKK